MATPICGLIGDTGNPADFRWAFLACGIAMLLGTVTFQLRKDKYVRHADGAPLGAKPERTVGHSPVVPVQTDGPVRAETIAAPAKSFASKLPMLIGLFVVVYAAIAWLMNHDWIGALVFSAMIVAPTPFSAIRR